MLSRFFKSHQEPSPTSFATMDDLPCSIDWTSSDSTSAPSSAPLPLPLSSFSVGHPVSRIRWEQNGHTVSVDAPSDTENTAPPLPRRINLDYNITLGRNVDPDLLTPEFLFYEKFTARLRQLKTRKQGYKPAERTPGSFRKTPVQLSAEIEFIEELQREILTAYFDGLPPVPTIGNIIDKANHKNPGGSAKHGGYTHKGTIKKLCDQMRAEALTLPPPEDAVEMEAACTYAERYPAFIRQQLEILQGIENYKRAIADGTIRVATQKKPEAAQAEFAAIESLKQGLNGLLCYKNFRNLESTIEAIITTAQEAHPSGFKKNGSSLLKKMPQIPNFCAELRAATATFVATAGPYRPTHVIIDDEDDAFSSSSRSSSSSSPTSGSPPTTTTSFTPW